MPAVDAETGKLLVSSDKTLVTSPDGHGGMLAALSRTGMLEEMQRRNIEYLHYHQVDNPTAIVCDPGLPRLSFVPRRRNVGQGRRQAFPGGRAERALPSASTARPQIIEYSDLPAEVGSQDRHSSTARCCSWAGSTAIHVFNAARSSNARRRERDDALPFHIARKKVPYCDEQGRDS